MSRKVQFLFLLVFVGLFLAATQPGFAQSANTVNNGPLNFGNNYFVSGDYVVGGAQGMNVNIASGYAAGTITIPDANPGITGAKSIPPGAEVVAALLYWQTVEKTGTVPGQAGSGENGYFMPIVAGGPKAPGYPIAGVNLASNDTVAYSSSGCTSTSTGDVVRTYRANVLAALPRDPTGNIAANGAYEVYLPSVRNSTPLTLGATLVLIYRILSPSVPLNSIVIYDGAFAPSTSSLTMKQTMQGFYDAASSPVSRITQIVGQGKPNKVETVYLNNTTLPSLYGIEPAFPGYYGTWDNPTWTFNPTESYVRVPNPILAGAASATTDVVAKSSSEGCVSWGALIVSTTVQNSDNDGLLDAWKVKPSGYANPGYCDASVNEGVCTPGSASWVDLPGAVHGEKDVFIQLDYFCSDPTGGDSCTTGDGTNYSFDPRVSGAVNLVTSAFAPASTSVHPDIHLHINPSGTNQPDLHAIPELPCVDNLTVSPPELCAFPGQPGVVAWKGGFDLVKNQLVDPSVSITDSVSACETTTPPTGCIPRFQPGKRTSWHYVLSAHAVGQPKWKLQDDSLEIVKQSGNTVTFTTSTAVGTLDQVVNSEGTFSADPSCPYGRVTILGAATNPSLNGTFCLKSAASSTGTTFTITVGGAATTGNYTYYTDPNLAVAPGYTSSASGVSDVGGADSMITLGLWGNPALNGAAPIASPVSDGQSEPVLAGTFMHELGHSIGLTHGGYTYPLAALGNYVPSLEPNCKPNFQSVMNYSFQVDLLSNGVSNVPDYSGQVLTSLNEAKAGAAGVLAGASYLTTYWYSPYLGVGNPVTIHCDGSPNTNGAEMALSTGLTTALSWKADQDINFDGNTTETLQGYNDWANIDLRQIGATGTNSTAEGGGQNFGGGGQNFGGGGQSLGGGGQNFGGGGQNFGGGGQSLGGGGQSLGGGGQNFGGGGQNFGGGGEVNVAVANSVTRPPQNLTATEMPAPRTIALSWTAPTFGQIGQYNIYRTVTGTVFSTMPYASVMGNPPVPTWTDPDGPCAAAGYEYFVTAVLSSTSANPGQESVGSNTVTTGGTATGQGLLTGCYTNTPPTVALNNLTVTTSSVVQGTAVPITWSLQDDSNTTGTYVSNLATNSLVAIGPVGSDPTCQGASPTGGTVTPLLTGGVKQSGAGASTFGFSANQFTFNWDTTPFSAGCYFFKLTLDSGQTETTTSALTVLIYVSDSSPHVTTTALPAGVVGQAYTNTIYEAGGVSPFTWSYTGSLPSGITLGAGTGMLSGTSCVSGNYSFTAKVTDSKSNYGTQGLMLQIQKATTATSVMPSLNASTYGQAVTFTATVSPQYSCVPTGTVTFHDGATAISGAITLTPGTNLSTASFTTTALQLAAATHSITAVYSGDANFYATGVSGSTAAVLSQKVNQAYTTTSVISSLNSSTYGQSVTFGAAVTPQYAGTPTGSVTFFDGATPISTAITLSSGGAMFTTTATQLGAGTHSIVAVYNGDPNFYATGSGGSTASALSQVVNQAATTTSVTSSLSPSTYGQMVTFTAAVANPYAGVPTGSVTFYDGTTPISAAINLSSASAMFTTTATQLVAGTHLITAVYGGDSNFFATGSGGSTATALTQTVTPAPLTATVSGTESSTPPTFTVTGIRYATFAGTDTASAVNGTLSCDVIVPSGGGVAGSNPISCTGLSAANYDILYDYSGLSPIVAASPATLTVNVTGTVQSGGSPTFTIASYTLSGLLNPDSYATATVSGTLSCAVLAMDSSSNYPISCSGLSISGVSNTYNIVYNYSYGISTATPPTPLTVAVDGTVKTGEGAPTFTINSITYSGLINGDTPSVVSGTLSCTVAVPATALSKYPITCSGLTAPNYNVSYNYTSSPQTVAATPAPLIVSVAGTESTSPAPTFTITSSSYSGLVNGNAPTVVTGTLSCTSSATADSSGNYPIYCSGLSATGYTITYSYSPGVGSTIVTSSPLTVTVSGTVQPGAAPPLNISSVTYTGFVNGDTLSAVTGKVSCTTKPGANVSTYVLSSCTGLNAPGYYTIFYSAGKITALAP